MILPTEKEILKKALTEKNVRFLAQLYFNVILTPLQQLIVRKIVFEEHRRLNISAMTRFGKSFAVAIGISLFIILNKNRKIYFIAPQIEQSMILRDYLGGLISICPAMIDILELTAQKEERLTVQKSRAHQTFKNGCEYRVFTAHDEADSLMGHGLGNEGGIIIVDEACKIKNEAYTKILRMLGDNPEKSTLIELYNPWTKDCKAYDHSLDPDFFHLRITWEDALREGRTTQEFIDKQRTELTKLEFDILYESKFPDQAQDALFDMSKVELCIQDKDRPRTLDFSSPWLIISCDVADKGIDKTVIMVGKQNKETRNYIVNEIYSEDISENTHIAGKINSLILQNRFNYEKIIVCIDRIGVGVGVLSMVNEFVKQNYLSAQIVGCHFGETPQDTNRFSNKKAEKYFKLKDLFEKNMISIPKHKTLLKELTSMSWGLNSRSRITIIDPDKSPDFADALCYFTWGEDVYSGGGYISV